MRGLNICKTAETDREIKKIQKKIRELVGAARDIPGDLSYTAVAGCALFPYILVFRGDWGGSK
jgi:hypothetical protein